MTLGPLGCWRSYFQNMRRISLGILLGESLKGCPRQQPLRLLHLRSCPPRFLYVFPHRSVESLGPRHRRRASYYPEHTSQLLHRQEPELPMTCVLPRPKTSPGDFEQSCLAVVLHLIL